MNKEKKSTKMDQFVNEAKTLQWSLASGKERTGHPPSSVETVLQTGGGLIQPSATASTAVAEKSPESIQEKRKDSSSDEVTMEQVGCVKHKRICACAHFKFPCVSEMFGWCPIYTVYYAQLLVFE